MQMHFLGKKSFPKKMFNQRAQIRNNGGRASLEKAITTRKRVIWAIYGNTCSLFKEHKKIQMHVVYSLLKNIKIQILKKLGDQQRIGHPRHNILQHCILFILEQYRQYLEMHDMCLTKIDETRYVAPNISIASFVVTETPCK